MVLIFLILMTSSHSAGRPGIQTAITETNFQLEKASDEFDWGRRFQQRGVGLVDQTMTLLRAPGQVITRQWFDWGVPVGSKGFYRFLPNVTTDPFTPEMEIYRAFANFSGGMRLAGSGWTNPASASGHQVEAVCIDGSFVKHPGAPPQCAHLKIALVNAVNVSATVGLRVVSCDAVGPGTAVTVDGSAPGVQRSAVVCGNVSQPVVLPPDSLVVVECRCTV